MYSVYSVGFDSTVVDDVVRVRENLNLEVGREPGGGEVDTEFTSIVKGEPTINVVTRQLKAVIDLMDVAQGSLAKNLSSLTTGLVVNWQKRADGGTMATGSNHLKGILADGLLCIQRITCEQGGDVDVEFEAKGLSSDGITNPYAVSEGQALLSKGAVDERFTIGPVSLLGVALNRIRRVEIIPNFEWDILRTDSDIFPTRLGITRRAPVIRLVGVDLAWLQASKIPILGGCGAQVDNVGYFRKRAGCGVFVDDETAEHVSYSMAGMAVVTERAADRLANGEVTVEVHGKKESAVNLMTWDTTAAIAA